MKMPKVSFTLSPIFALAILAIQVSMACAQPISLAVKLDHKSILPVAPQGILVELTNGTDAPLKLKNGLYAGFILQEQGQSKPIWYRLQDGVATTQADTLAPGQSARILYWMKINAAQSLEPSTREYTLTARLDEFESAPQSFAVAHLAGRELEAAKYLQEKGLLIYYQESAMERTLHDRRLLQVAENFANFINNYPDSSYIPLAKLALIDVNFALNYEEQEFKNWMKSGNESQQAIDLISSGYRRLYGEAAFQRMLTRDYAQSLLTLNKEAEILAQELDAPLNVRGWILAKNIARLRADKSAMSFYSAKQLEAINRMTFAN